MYKRQVYYLLKYKDHSYLGRALSACTTQSTADLFSRLATQIFDEQFDEATLLQRQCALCEAGKYHVQIIEQAEQKIQTKLISLAENPEIGYDGALKYVTTLTSTERYLLIEWLGQQKIERESVKELFPELYYYTAPLNLGLEEENIWINTYFDAYRQSKLSNSITAQLSQIIKKKNASVSAEKKSSSGQSASSRTTQNASIAASADEETLLAALVQCEAGGTSVQCMTAVGAVVVNRVRSGGFANSIYGVIYQRGQFGPASSGRLEARLASGVSASARQAARAALNGSDPTGGAKYFKLASSGHAGTVVGPIVFY